MPGDVNRNEEIPRGMEFLATKSSGFEDDGPRIYQSVERCQKDVVPAAPRKPRLVFLVLKLVKNSLNLGYKIVRISNEKITQFRLSVLTVGTLYFFG